MKTFYDDSRFPPPEADPCRSVGPVVAQVVTEADFLADVTRMRIKAECSADEFERAVDEFIRQFD